MINQLPKFAQKPVQNFLKTGQFKNHVSEPLDKSDIKDLVQNFTEMPREILAQDNSSIDLDPKVGVVETREDSFIGEITSRYEAGADGDSFEGYMLLGLSLIHI